MNDEIADLADWAEDRFSTLCSKAGVTRNKSVQDRTGWDYLIEFPDAEAGNLPADLRPMPPSARVQVKSKRTGKACVTLSLSNALRFAKDPLPCFVVLFLTTDGKEPVRIYSRHFGAEEIGRALKRAREAHAAGRNDLNKLSITFNFSAQDEHDCDLMSWMANTVGRHADRYAEQKAELARTLGFEDSSIHGNIQFRAADLSALVDHQIGLSPSAPPLRITVKQRRFGIDAVEPLFDGKPDFAHLRSHPRACRVRVRGSSGSDIWLDGELFLPSLGDLPIELRKLRVVADFVQIVVSGVGIGEVTFDLDGTVQRSLRGLRAVADVLTAAEEGPLQFQISSEGDPQLPFTVRMPVERDGDELRQLSNVIACLEKASAGLLPPELTLSLDEIDRAWNAIVDFNGMVAGTGMKAKFELDRPPPPNLGPARSIFLYDFVDIGDWTFMAVVRRPVLRLEIDGTHGAIDFGDARVVEASIRRGKGRESLFELRELYAQARRLEGTGVLEFYGGEYRALSAGASESQVILSIP